MEALKFSEANSKIRKLKRVSALNKFLNKSSSRIYSLDLLSGWSCPFADKCFSKVIQSQDGRKIKDGGRTEFRCFSASQEALLTNVYNLRKHNFYLLRKLSSREDFFNLINSSLPKDAGIVRIHVGGDFFSENYFLGWLDCAKANPSVLFYAYTKSIQFWTRNILLVNSIENIVLTASRGGRRDDLIDKFGLRSVQVVYSKYEARKLKLPVDINDSHAARPDKKYKNFALVIHGVQPKGTRAAIVWNRIKYRKAA